MWLGIVDARPCQCRGTTPSRHRLLVRSEPGGAGILPRPCEGTRVSALGREHADLADQPCRRALGLCGDERLVSAAGDMHHRTDGAFGRLVLGASLSSIADGVTFMALPLLLISTGAGPAEVGRFLAVMQAPRFLAPFAGALVDRLPRRFVMCAANALRAIAVLGIAFLFRAEHGVAFVGLYGAAITLGFGDVIYSSALPTYLPTIVADEDLEVANGRVLGLTNAFAALVGPSLGVVLYKFGPTIPLIFDAICFVVAAIAMLMLPESHPPRIARSRLIDEVKESLVWLWREPRLMTLYPCVGANNMALATVRAVLVFYAQDILHVTGAAYGAVVSAFGVGGLVAGVCLPRILSRFSVSVLLQASPFLLSGSIVAMAAFPTALVAAVAMVIGGAALVAWNAAAVGVRQRIVPNDRMGRISSVGSLVMAAAMSSGSAGAGALAATVGISSTLLAAALLPALGGLFLLIRSSTVAFPVSGPRRQS
jgi:MFS family permease